MQQALTVKDSPEIAYSSNLRRLMALPEVQLADKTPRST
jgi:hypothetical protein